MVGDLCLLGVAFVDDDSVVEGCGLALLPGVGAGLVLKMGFCEVSGAERVGGIESVASDVPVGGMVEVSGSVENGDADGLAVYCADVVTPGGPLAPALFFADLVVGVAHGAFVFLVDRGCDAQG